MTLDVDENFFTQPTFEADAGWTPQLEKDYCTNYTCCGLMLADLHELVGHFEERHVTVVSPTGMPLWCGSPSSAGGASSSGSVSPASPQNPFPTLTSAFTPVMTTGSRDPGGYLAQSCMPKEEEEYVFDAMLRNEVYNVPVSVAPQCTVVSQAHANHDTSHDTSHAMTRIEPPVDPPTRVHPPTIAPTPVHARPPTLSIITDTEPERTWSERRKRGRRERTHKCPHEGCIKTYLNLNGLKYHLTKGACVYE